MLDPEPGDGRVIRLLVAASTRYATSSMSRFSIFRLDRSPMQ